MTTQENAIEWLDFEHYSDAPIFNTKAVVQQTGVPAPTLRAWERRYKLVAPERANNAYRLYSQRDIALIRWLKERVDAGVAISHAVALFRHMYEEYQRRTDCDKALPSAPSPVESQGPSRVIVTSSTQEELQETAVKSAVGPLTEPHWTLADIEQSASGYPTVHNMRAARWRIIEAFQHFDEAGAGILMSSMLAIYPLEQVCTDLITPTLWQIGQLWSEGELTVSVEHFASNFFRGLLTNLLRVTPSPLTGPLVITCCAPGEQHELAALMLTLFLRRNGIRVAYLGQSIEAAGLLHTIKQVTPAMICISLTMSSYLPELIQLGQQIQLLPEPRPLLAFGGQALLQQKQTLPQFPGLYLNGDMREIVIQIRTIILEEHFDDKN
ncbi:MAG TPA: MerR family transcriptional regulator [Ktedonosporobacter sp.]|jgi:DNA-binding transcriptional MerR regulator/methanogenic corrinoid protein MtbC1|nr:MerR family transcriptional regulator [Ktedonosporobacter sp.]